jgi:hypothetical protein
MLWCTFSSRRPFRSFLIGHCMDNSSVRLGDDSLLINHPHSNSLACVAWTQLYTSFVQIYGPKRNKIHLPTLSAHVTTWPLPPESESPSLHASPQE